MHHDANQQSLSYLQKQHRSSLEKLFWTVTALKFLKLLKNTYGKICLLEKLQNELIKFYIHLYICFSLALTPKTLLAIFLKIYLQ